MVYRKNIFVCYINFQEFYLFSWSPNQQSCFGYSVMHMSYYKNSWFIATLNLNIFFFWSHFPTTSLYRSIAPKKYRSTVATSPSQTRFAISQRTLLVFFCSQKSAVIHITPCTHWYAQIWKGHLPPKRSWAWSAGHI